MVKIITDYYKVLKVDKNANREEITKAYNERMDFHKKHPYQDRSGILQLLDEAKDVLLNPNKRKQYDIDLSNYYKELIKQSKRNIGGTETDGYKKQLTIIGISLGVPILVAKILLAQSYQYILNNIFTFLIISTMLYAIIAGITNYELGKRKQINNSNNKENNVPDIAAEKEQSKPVSKDNITNTPKSESIIDEQKSQLNRYLNTKARLDNVTGQIVIIEDLKGHFIRAEGIEEFMANNKGYVFKEKPHLDNISSQETKVTETDRLQKMLDDYWNGKWKKSKEVIGRDYERYIGYLYEENGFNVYYQGITMGVEDGGIDLICKKENRIELIQCKYWGKEKTIYEKHINQLYGATTYYKNKNDKNNEMSLIEGEKKIFLHPVFVTSIQLSDEAKDVAKSLNIEVIEGLQIDTTYPSIKCNISSKGNKIYHLPFDGLYDKTKVSKKGECYVRTVSESKNLGFRHANN
jgi:curved DNA-binding protein CbpA